MSFLSKDYQDQEIHPFSLERKKKKKSNWVLKFLLVPKFLTWTIRSLGFSPILNRSLRQYVVQSINNMSRQTNQLMSCSSRLICHMQNIRQVL
jgi:hypothetical protein